MQRNLVVISNGHSRRVPKPVFLLEMRDHEKLRQQRVSHKDHLLQVSPTKA